MLSVIRKICGLLSKKEQRQALSLLILMVFMSFVEVLGIASILPFMAVLSAPETVETNRSLQMGYDFFGFESTNSYLFFLGLVILVVLVASNILKAVTQWATLNFSYMRGYSFGRRLFAHYLNQPYSFYLQRHSGDLVKNVMGEVQSLTSNIIVPLMDIMARSLVSLFILFLLVIVDPVLAITSFVVLGGAFVTVYAVFQTTVLRLGRERYKAQSERYKFVNEAIHGIKNVKLTGHEETYNLMFDRPSYRFGVAQTKNGVIQHLPRYALEIIAFGGVLLIVLYLILTEKGLDKAMPLLALYAFSGYRLMPNLQGIYTSVTKIRFNLPVLETISDEMSSGHQYKEIKAEKSDNDALSFNKEISTAGLRFHYENTERNILENVNLSIKANTTIGIVGETGSGKTTLVDLLLGLLSPTAGQIIVDGEVITQGNLRAWQKNLAYVSQHIYLCDDTLTRNIAFGISDDNIDHERVKWAADMASISAYIEKDLPEKYETMIGENGVRLSGGQRQRVGLARALYLDRPVLVLDEATSALDSKTEESVMSAIENLNHKKTIIMIAHRAHTLKTCDQIIRLVDGQVQIEESRNKDR